MSLRVFVKSATDLPKTDRFSKSDPYCELTFNDERRSTKVINNDQNPEWNEAFKWTLEVVPEPTEVIEVEILDHETLSSTSMAKGIVTLASVLEKGSTSLDVALTSPEGEPLESQLHVDLNYKVPVCEALKREVSEAKVRIEELEELLRNLRAAAVEKERELSETKGHVEQLQLETTGLSTTVAAKESELSDAKDQIERLKAAITEKEGQLSDIKEHLKVEIDGLKAKATEKDGELSETKEQLQHLKAENSDLKAAAAGKEGELSDAKQQIERLKVEATDAETKIEQLQGELSASSAVDDLKSQNESLKGEVSALRQQIEEQEEEQQKSDESPQEPPPEQAQEGWCNLL